MSILLRLRRSGTTFLTSLPNLVWGHRNFSRRMAAILMLAAGMRVAAVAQNPGDPLFCQPNEGVNFLIVNGGAGVFTVDPDCYNNNINNDTTTTITTTQGGTLTLTRTPSAGNYVYTPPTANYTGLDTFTIGVTTVFNAAGGPGSAGGTVRPGGATTLTVTLVVIPATTQLGVGIGASPTLVPVPAGYITGCGAQGNAGAGPPPAAVSGCITGIVRGTQAPSHGSLSISGNSLLYTPNGTYAGSDTFTYQAVGINTDGSNALNSGNVTVQVGPNGAAPSATPAPPTVVLLGIGLLGLASMEAWRKLRRAREASF